jgi:hypothetical protein
MKMRFLSQAGGLEGQAGEGLVIGLSVFSVRLCGNIETAGRAPVARVEHSIECGHADSLSVICLGLADLDSYPCNNASICLETTTGDCPRRWAQISFLPFEPIRTTQPLPLSVL